VLRWSDPIAGVVNAKDLGVEYLARYPDEADSATLVSRLSTLVSPFSLLTGVSAGRLHEGIRRDFLQDDVVKMGGWLLSRTELRLCALVALRAQMEDGMSGVFGLQQEQSGDNFHWTTPRAAFTVPSGLPKLEFRLRSGTSVSQRVAVRIDGKGVDELLISGPLWRPIQYAMRTREALTLRLELETTPAWKPANDFRTIGVGIDRAWTA
jgi:hypothetical protein